MFLFFTNFSLVVLEKFVLLKKCNNEIQMHVIDGDHTFSWEFNIFFIIDLIAYFMILLICPLLRIITNKRVKANV